jgi:hypothetical protein
MLSSKRPAAVYDESVYAPINKCQFIPDCAYERLLQVLKFPCAIVRVFESDSGRHRRFVAFSLDGAGLAGILTDKWGAVYEEASPEAPQGTLEAIRALAYTMPLRSDKTRSKRSTGTLRGR